jgi:hypothetical protein
MRLRRRPMVIRDVQACAELITSHPLERERYGELADGLSTAWRQSLRAGSLITTVIEDLASGMPCLQGFGVSAFVTDEFVSYCKTASMRWIGPGLVKCLMRDHSPILSPKEIRDANSTDGLNLASWASFLRPQNPSDRDHVQIELMSGFMQEHCGFKLKEIIAQPNEPVMMEIVLNSGGFLWDSGRKGYMEVNNCNVEEVLRTPFILGANRNTASQHLSWTTTLFQYSQPRICLKPAQQRLLVAAIKGRKDAELSDELSVSLSFVKKTWSSIYARVADKLPELDLDISTSLVHQRGREKKQRVLAYLRDHPEELRPISREE